jgi:hypothetical protein
MAEAILALESVQSFCKLREIDLVLIPAPAPFVLCFRAQFDGYGEFFFIVAKDVEYADIVGGITVGGLRVTSDIDEVVAMTPKWRELRGRISGPALLLRSADAETWEAAGPADLCVLVANGIEFRPGKDWERAGGKS